MKKAFTLTEILVTMGTIAMLTAIVLPGLSAARNAGRNTKCLSNLRGLATGEINDYFHLQVREEGVDDWRQITYCPSDRTEDSLSSYRILVVPKNPDVYNISTIPIVSDRLSFHGWFNEGYLDGHSERKREENLGF